MARNTPLAPMIGAGRRRAARRRADPLPQDRRTGRGDAASHGGRRPAQGRRLPAQRGRADDALRRQQADAARSGPGAGVRATGRGATRLAHRRAGAGAGPEIVARPAGLLLELSGATIADVMVARSGIEPMAVRLLAETATPAAFDELDAHARRRHPRGLAVGSAGRGHRRVPPPHGRAVRQRDADDHRGHAARDHRAAHGIRHQGAPRGVQGRLRQADPVLPAADDAAARRRRRRRRGALAQAPRHRAQPAAEGPRGPSRSATSCSSGRSPTTSRGRARRRPTAGASPCRRPAR